MIAHEQCSKCGSNKYYLDKKNDVHIGEYCSNCDSYKSWVDKELVEKISEEEK